MGAGPPSNRSLPGTVCFKLGDQYVFLDLESEFCNAEKDFIHRNVRKEFARDYPFVAEAVSVKFGNHHNHMFLDLETEFWNIAEKEDQFVQDFVVYPFVEEEEEEAVSFNFNDDYGILMFRDLEKELDFDRYNRGRGLCADVFARPDQYDHFSNDDDDDDFFVPLLDLDF